MYFVCERTYFWSFHFMPKHINISIIHDFGDDCPSIGDVRQIRNGGIEWKEGEEGGIGGKAIGTFLMIDFYWY